MYIAISKEKISEEKSQEREEFDQEIYFVRPAIYLQKKRRFIEIVLYDLL